MSGSRETQGLAWGFLGVVLFSLTLPATRAAVAHLDPLFVALGRALLAATCAAAVLAVLPLATAAAAAAVARERPSFGFWAVGVAGSLVVVAFALREGGGALLLPDLALLAAVISAAFGYALGARAAVTLGGWQAISWSLVLCIPPLVPAVLAHLPDSPREVPAGAWAGFLYVALVSQYVGFFAWYRGLSLGGIARAGQLQLLQPLLTIAASAVLVAEALRSEVLAFALAVVALVALGRRMPVRRSSPPAGEG